MSEAFHDSVRLAVVGRFPPPIDGQTLATQRLAEVLATDGTGFVVNRINTEPSGSAVAVRASRKTSRLLHFVRLRSRMGRALQSFNPAAVLWASVSPDVAGHVRDRLLSLPAFPPSSRSIAVVHRGNFDRLYRRRLTTLSARRMTMRVDAFVFLSEHLSNQCSKWIPAAKRFVVPNTIDKDVLFTSDQVDVMRAEKASRSSLRVLYLSNMIPSKGYEDVATAVAMLRGRDVTARFVGDWQSERDHRRFEALVADLGAGDLIEVLGPVRDRNRIRLLYEDADVLVLPTYYPNEAQPLVLLEALNAGIPVIVTRHASIPELIDDGRSGYFVAPRSPAEIAEALERMRDPAEWQHLSRGAREAFDQRFSPDAVRSAWIELVQHVLEH